MADTKFQAKFSKEEFLTAFSGDGLYTTGWFSERIGCSSRTAKTYLDNLVAEGSVKKVPVDEGQSFLWQLTKKRKRSHEND